MPKDGGNTFHGTLSGNFANESLQAHNYADELKARGLVSPNRVKAVWAVSPAYGGPIRKNRLWFIGGAQVVTTDNYVAGVFANADTSGWRYVPDLNRQMVIDQDYRGVVGRLTWQASRRNKVSMHGEYSYPCFCKLGTNVTPEAAWRATFPGKTVNATWTSTLTNRLFVKAGGQSYHLDPYHLAANGNGRSVVDNGGPYAGFRFGSSASDTSIDSRVVHARGSVAYVTGSHNLTFGADTRLGFASPSTNAVPGNVTYVLLNSLPSSVTYSSGPIIQRNRYLPDIGIFGQEQWTMARLTVNAGIRFDMFRAGYPDQVLPAAQYRPQERRVTGANVVSWTDLNPRLGVAYDLFGDGRTAVKASLGRYVAQEAVALTQSANPVNSTSGNQTRTWNDDGDFVVQGDPLNLAANGELGASSNQNFGQIVVTTRVDPAFAQGYGVRPFNWEFSTQVQHQLAPGLGVSLGYYRRWFGNIQLTDNLATASSDFEPYCVTAPGDSRLPQGGGYRICDLYDVVPSKRGAQDSIIRSSGFYGKQISHWNGVDVLVDARLRGGLLLGGGMSFGKTTDDTCDIVAKVDNPSPYLCHIETPFLANAKMLASYTLPWGMLVAGTFQSLPGPDITASYTARNAEIVPSLGRNLAAGSTATVAVPLIASGTMYGKRTFQFDARLGKRFMLGSRRLQTSIDLYNILNGNAILSQNNTYGTNGASWQVPLSILSPRLVKFSMELSF